MTDVAAQSSEFAAALAGLRGYIESHGDGDTAVMGSLDALIAERDNLDDNLARVQRHLKYEVRKHRDTQEALAYIEQRLTAPEGGHVTSSYAAAVDARERARATLASGGTPLASDPDLGGASSGGNDGGRGAAALASVRARTP